MTTVTTVGDGTDSGRKVKKEATFLNYPVARRVFCSQNRRMARGDKKWAPHDSLMGEDPESLMAVARCQQRAREIVARLREELSPQQRRWLAAFELEVRCDEEGEIDIGRAARNMGSTRKAAMAALESIRRLLREHD